MKPLNFLNPDDLSFYIYAFTHSDTMLRLYLLIIMKLNDPL
jgi:hypothetical protein